MHFEKKFDLTGKNDFQDLRQLMSNYVANYAFINFLYEFKLIKNMRMSQISLIILRIKHKTCLQYISMAQNLISIFRINLT